jgi:hypothetical protein
MRGAIPPLPQYVFIAWCLIKKISLHDVKLANCMYRDNFIHPLSCRPTYSSHVLNTFQTRTVWKGRDTRQTSLSWTWHLYSFPKTVTSCWNHLHGAPNVSCQLHGGVLLKKLRVLNLSRSFPRFSWKPKAHYHLYMNLPLDPVLSQFNPVKI